MTIRRDLQALEEHGKRRRVRGGAIVSGPQTFGLLPPVPQSAAIGMDCSSTIYRMACGLQQAQHLTVLTFGMETFQALREAPGVRTYVTGGERDERTGSPGRSSGPCSHIEY